MINKSEDELMEHWEEEGRGPLVSICCITYNHEKYISEAIDGFLMQKTDFPIEILLHDDASTDTTAEIIRAYEAKYPHIIKPIYQTENQYSKGLKMNPTFNFPRVRGKYIAMCEGDDYWTDPMKLQKQIDFMQAHPEYAMCFHNTVSIDETGTNPQKPFSDLTEARDYALEDLFESNPTNPSAVVYRTIPIRFPKIFEKIAFGDWALHILHAEHGKIRYLPDVMSVYRIHQNGVWSQRGSIGRIRDTLEMLKTVDAYFDNKYHHLISRSMGKFYFQLAHSYGEADEMQKAKQYLKMAQDRGAVSMVGRMKFALRNRFPVLHAFLKKMKEL